MIAKNTINLYFSVTYIQWQELKFPWCQLVQSAAKNIPQHLRFQSSETLYHITCCSTVGLPAASILIFITMRTSNIIHNYFPFHLTVWRYGLQILLIMLKGFPFLAHPFSNVCTSLNCISFPFDCSHSSCHIRNSSTHIITSYNPALPKHHCKQLQNKYRRWWYS